MQLVKAKIVLFLFLMIIWLGLTYPVTSEELAAGAITALVIMLLPLGSTAVFREFRLTPKAIGYAIAYVIAFLFELVKSNLDVAFRVLAPQLPINPGIVRVKTRLTSQLGRTLLANSITLTPGTITVETRGEDFFIHWINVQTEDTEAATRAIVSKFERYLEVIFG